MTSRPDSPSRGRSRIASLCIGALTAGAIVPAMVIGAGSAVAAPPLVVPATVITPIPDGRPASAAQGDRVFDQVTLPGGGVLALHVSDADRGMWGTVTGAPEGSKIWIERFTGPTSLKQTFSTVPALSGSATTSLVNDAASPLSTGLKIPQSALVQACVEVPASSTICTAKGRSDVGDVIAAAEGLRAFYSSSTNLFDVDPTGLQPTQWIKWWHSAVATSSLVATYKVTGDQAYLNWVDEIYLANKDKDEDLTGGNFTNHFVDDTGWWAMALIDAYRVTGKADYLKTAEKAAAFMANQWQTDPCSGLLWHTTAMYRSAISNGLYLQVNSALAQVAATPLSRATYLNRAKQEWAWYSKSGGVILNAPQPGQGGTLNFGANIVVDGVDGNETKVDDDGNTVNNENYCKAGGHAYTYNQGVPLSGLAELSTAPGGANHLGRGQSMANAFTNSSELSPLDTDLNFRIMRDTGDASAFHQQNFGFPTKNDGPVFKGPAVRGIAELNAQLPGHPYARYLAEQQVAAKKNAQHHTGNASRDFYDLRWFELPEANGADINHWHIGNQISALNLLTFGYTAPLRKPTVTLSAAANAEGWRAAKTATIANPAPQTNAVLEYAVVRGTAPVVWQPATTQIQLPSGEYTLQVRVRDAVSSTQRFSSVSRTAVKIDFTAPALTVKSDPIRRSFTASATDATSGVVSLEYRIDSGAWLPYTSRVSVDDATTVVDVRAIDEAGNQAVRTVAIKDAQTLTSAANVTTEFGGKKSVTVRVKGLDGTPSGKVSVAIGKTKAVTGTLKNGKASVAIPKSLGIGKHTVRLRYLGSSTHLASSSSSRVTVKKATAKVTLSAIKTASSASRATAKFKVVTKTKTAPKGKVTLTVRKGSTTMSKVTVKVSKAKTVSVKLPKLRSGMYSVKATYSGNKQIAGTSSSAKSFRIR